MSCSEPVLTPAPTEAPPVAQREQRVTPLELFFDLVFVYALTQVTQLMAHDATWPGVGGGLLVLAALWWAWSGYAWLTNALEPEAGAVRAGMFGAMAAMLLVALAVPGAFGAEAVLFGVAYVLVRLLNLGLDALAARATRPCAGRSGASRRRPRSPPGSSWWPASSPAPRASRSGSPRSRSSTRAPRAPCSAAGGAGASRRPTSPSATGSSSSSRSAS